MKNRPGRKNKTGFTMVEIIIVVAVIAVLASIIIPKMSGARDSSKLAACKANLKHIGIAAGLYANDNDGAYSPYAVQTNFSVNSSCYLVTGGYLKTAPICSASSAYYGAWALYPPDYPTLYVHCGQTTHASMGMPTYRPAYTPERGVIVVRP